MLFHVTNIKYDTSDSSGKLLPEEGVSLPREMKITCDGEDQIADIISDSTGWLVKSFICAEIKEFHVGDIITLTDIAETYRFKVTRVTRTTAIARHLPVEVVPDVIVPRYLDDIRLCRQYEKIKAAGWNFFKVKTIPSDNRWLQASVETTEPLQS